ncbi:sugar phosphate isomerase/epimerase family protein [Paenibacillus sp. YIM B09110]|uniref:sugar phosphate isomerase/epimerase family protein n=1 Tax=Paenibacillus sp. YIM B09110 TaxID=3126102 RepID=UPI00301DE252
MQPYTLVMERMIHLFPFKTALNASTLFPFQLNVLEQIRIAAGAGFEGIELWVKDIEAYLQNGGTPVEIKSCLEESGIAFVNAIAFFKWSDANLHIREAGFSQAEREIAMLSELGCQAVAAPPFGDVEHISIKEMADNFARLVSLGRSYGVEPYLEFWGRANKLSVLDEALCVALESGVPDAKILLDPFHMYTGGSDISAMKRLNGTQIGIFHVNDYPGFPGKEAITDAERVFPGEGIAPSREFATNLIDVGYRGYLSLELFMEDYGGMNPREVAVKSLLTMKNAYTI